MPCQLSYESFLRARRTELTATAMNRSMLTLPIRPKSPARASGRPGHREAERRGHEVGHDQPDAREPDPAVGLGQAVAPDDVIQPRGARHEQELDQGEEGADERGELPDRGRD